MSTMDLFAVNAQIDELGYVIIPDDMTDEELKELFEMMIDEGKES